MEVCTYCGDEREYKFACCGEVHFEEEIEQDKQDQLKQLEDTLYCLWMTADSSVSIEEMKLLCLAAGVQFPPQKQEQV